MQPVQLSLVIGEPGSGVSTLLAAFARRADAQTTRILDPGRASGANGDLGRTCDVEGITALLRQDACDAGPLVLAAHDLRAPRRLLQALADDPNLGASHRLNAVTLAIDASAAKTDVKAVGPADPCDRAAAVADRIVLTKTDLAEPGAVKRLASTLKTLNPPAPILRARHGDIGPARLVDGGLFDPVTSSVDIDRWLCEAAFGFEAARRGGPDLPETALSRLRNDVGVGFFAVTIDQPVEGTVLSVFLKLLMAEHGGDLLRLKGIVAIADHPDRPALIDGREHLIQPLLWLPAWPTADRRSRLVFSTLDVSETWIRTLLTALSDQLRLQETPVLQLALTDKAG
ncbi:MAG: GTP-binding protein [Alphaproteobacteria bacterium]